MTLFVCFPIFCCRCTPSLQVISEKNKLEAEPQAPLNSEKLKSIIAMEQGREIQAFLLSNEDPMLQEYDTCCEASRLCFRQSQYSEEARPHENFSRLWELCCQWLQPQLRSLDQVLELLVLEQFFAILPTEIETRVRAHGPESRERLFELIEHLQREREASGHQFDMGDILLEELAPFQMVPPLPDVPLEAPALPLTGPVQEAAMPGACSPQAGLQELNRDAADECLPLLDAA